VEPVEGLPEPVAAFPAPVRVVVREATTAALLYAENYAILHDVAERLRSGGPDDIDSLVADFRRAMQAYGVCRDRLESIRREIDADVDRIKTSNDAVDPRRGLAAPHAHE
jgi:exonuclease VII small subunit